MPSDLDVTRVLPYLKAVLHDDGSPAVKVSKEDAPVLRSFVGRLVTAYVVDKGDRFEYVTHRQVATAGLTEDRVHPLCSA